MTATLPSSFPIITPFDRCVEFSRPSKFIHRASTPSGEVGHALISAGFSDCQMKIAMRLLDAVHFRCLNARGTLFTVQKALPLFNVFVDIMNRLVWHRCRWVRAWGSRASRRPAPMLAYRYTPGC